MKTRYILMSLGHYYDGTIRTDVIHEYFNLENALSEYALFMERPVKANKEYLYLLIDTQTGAILEKKDMRPVEVDSE